MGPEMTESRGRSVRSYNQYCAVARGLDVIGDRWTLLLVRNLLLGPKRYKDLLEGLPGIGTNLLAARLRELEDVGLLERAVLPPPAGSTVYRLTETGAALEPVLMAISRWGGRFLGRPRPEDALVPSAYFVALRAAFQPDVAAHLEETYEFRIAGSVFEVRVDGGVCSTREGEARNPDAVLTLSVETLDALLFEGLSPEDALSNGRVEVRGDPRALDRFLSVFDVRAAALAGMPG